MIKALFRICIITIITLVFKIESHARHIVGGDVIYTCVRSDAASRKTTFLVEFRIYRDSRGGGAEFDARPNFGIYRLTSTGWIVHSIVESPLIRRDDLPIVSNKPCVVIPVNVAVDRGLYRFEVTLDWGSDYQVVYQRCCRNNSISNIVDPGDQGAAFNVVIRSGAVENCNNSPVFRNFPPILICANSPLNFDHSASDIDGDSVTYEFCLPSAAGGTFGTRLGENSAACNGVMPNPTNCRPPYSTVTFSQGFSISAPMAGNPVISLDQRTGRITGTPRIVGQYVIGICVKEYRRGLLIGQIQRDFQFNVTLCEDIFDASADARDNSNNRRPVTINDRNDTILVKSCGASNIYFNNTTKVSIPPDPTYRWEFNIRDSIIKVERNNLIDKKHAIVSFPAVGRYFGKLIANPDSIFCTDTAEIIVDVLPTVDANFSTQYDTCIYGPVNFLNSSVVLAGGAFKSTWDFNRAGNSQLFNPSFSFNTPGLKRATLTIEDRNQCISTFSKDFNFQPVPVTIEMSPDRFLGCEPVQFNFTNTSVPVDETYTIEWRFGDGGTSNRISPSHVYRVPGIYDVYVSIKSPIGCFIDREYKRLIEIKESPDAAFSYDPLNPSAFRPEVNFTSLATKTDFLQWQFGEVGASTDLNPTFIFPDTGVYRIIQIAVKNNGCVDSALATIDIVPIATVQVPNAFTPNNDLLNDDFRVKGFFDGIKEFKMTVFNRWGELLFETDSPEKGWNGQKNNNGYDAPQDVYVYLVEFKTPRDEPKSLKGHVTLMR